MYVNSDFPRRYSDEEIGRGCWLLLLIDILFITLKSIELKLTHFQTIYVDDKETLRRKITEWTRREGRKYNTRIGWPGVTIGQGRT